MFEKGRKNEATKIFFFIWWACWNSKSCLTHLHPLECEGLGGCTGTSGSPAWRGQRHCHCLPAKTHSWLFMWRSTRLVSSGLCQNYSTVQYMIDFTACYLQWALICLCTGTHTGKPADGLCLSLGLNATVCALFHDGLWVTTKVASLVLLSLSGRRKAWGKFANVPPPFEGCLHLYQSWRWRHIVLHLLGRSFLPSHPPGH